jgi:ATP-dependent exoDNAse (exonuclease V) alpha subunit
LLTSRDVLVIDEAGMIGSRQMERILGKAEAAGAKVVLAGDAEQLQAIEAGAAFRALTERHGAVEITEIRRQREGWQREGWQREATRELATGRTDAALARYEAVGTLQGHVTREVAREAFVAGWDAARLSRPESANPAGHQALLHASDFVGMNQKPLAACPETAAKTGKPQRCVVQVGVPPFDERVFRGSACPALRR